jgi:hypothetical protein
MTGVFLGFPQFLQQLSGITHNIKPYIFQFAVLDILSFRAAHTPATWDTARMVRYMAVGQFVSQLKVWSFSKVILTPLAS